jgi:CheY-like chemotaxis protein
MEVMAVLSHVLVVEPKKDPEIERALERPGFELSFASELNEALKLAAALAPTIIILDTLFPGFNGWKLIAEIWEAAKKSPHPPALILLTDDVATWNVDHFGPVRFSDRQHLKETFRDAILELEQPSMPELPPEATWERVRDHMWERGIERIKSEQNRMRKLGILDERGRATSKEWPADMKPGSTTDVAT